MIYANFGGEKILASRGVEGKCPSCESTVIAKCGEIVTWHWAHRPDSICSQNEPETQWHIDWKKKFPKECVEIKIGENRADVFINGYVIEFQHSPISTEDIRKRENNYKNMIWIFNTEESFNSERLSIRESTKGTFWTFRWRHPRKSVFFCHSPVYLDLGKGSFQEYRGDILKIKKLYYPTENSSVTSGWGWLISSEYFISARKRGIPG